MVEASELVVAIKDEGIGETKDNLEGVEDSMEDTAAAASDSADELEGFTESISGAMQAAAAGVAIAAGSLLSQIPVIGEVAAGLGAVFSAIGLQIDQLLRDLGVGGLTGILFDVADAIISADGAAADLVGVLGILATMVAGAATGVAAWAVKVYGVVGAFGQLGAALKAAGTAIAGIVGGISAVTAALAVAVAAVVAFAAAYITNFRDVRTTTNNILGEVWNFFTGLASDLADWAGELASGAWNWGTNAISNFLGAIEEVGSGVADWFTDLASKLANWASDIANDAYDWGVSLMQGLLDGILSFAEEVVNAFESVINGIIQTINTALDQLPEEVTSRVGVEQFDLVDFDPDFGAGAGREATGGRGGGTPQGRQFPGSRTGSSEGVQIDGRQLSESTGRYRVDSSRRRGL